PSLVRHAGTGVRRHGRTGRRSFCRRPRPLPCVASSTDAGGIDLRRWDMYFVWVPGEPDPFRRTDVPKVIDPSADEPTLRTTLAGLTYEELVSAWHSSERRLATEPDPCRRGALVVFRDLLLDE